MIGRNAAWRLGGVLALAAAGGTSLLHRGVWVTYIHGPATGVELVLGLASFVLASLGMLLLMHGAALHDEWSRECECREQTRSEEPFRTPDAEADPARMIAIAADPFALPGGRAAIAMFLAHRAMRVGANDLKDASHPPQKITAGNFS